MSLLPGGVAALACAGISLLSSAGAAAACAICLSAVGMTPGERLDLADRAVLALPDGAQGWRIVADIKGEQPVAAGALADALASEPDDQAVLFLREGLGGRWGAIGEVGMGHTDWLRELARTPVPGSAASLSDHEAEAAAWQTRLALAATQFRSTESAVAELAHGDLARAPYGAIRDIGRTQVPSGLLQFIADEDIPSRRAAYILLLGGAGGDTATTWLGDRIDDAWQQGDPTDVAALLTAWIEATGDQAVQDVTMRYLLDPGRTLPEIEAALLALAVHGDGDDVARRAAVVAAYRRFIRVHPAMAGFVASDLMRWEAWEATADYVALLNDGVIDDGAGAFAALNFIHRSPDMAARSELNLIDD